jgi:hypothetical protein
MTPATSPVRIEMLNGVPIYFEVHGSGYPLLLLHGFSGCGQDLSAFIGSQSHSTRREKVCGGATPAETRRLKGFWRAARRLRTAMTTRISRHRV